MLETAQIAKGYQSVSPGLVKIRGFGDRQEGFGLGYCGFNRWKEGGFQVVLAERSLIPF